VFLNQYFNLKSVKEFFYKIYQFVINFLKAFLIIDLSLDKKYEYHPILLFCQDNPFNLNFEIKELVDLISFNIDALSLENHQLFIKKINHLDIERSFLLKGYAFKKPLVLFGDLKNIGLVYAPLIILLSDKLNIYVGSNQHKIKFSKDFFIYKLVNFELILLFDILCQLYIIGVNVVISLNFVHDIVTQFLFDHHIVLINRTTEKDLRIISSIRESFPHSSYSNNSIFKSSYYEEIKIGPTNYVFLVGSCNLKVITIIVRNYNIYSVPLLENYLENLGSSMKNVSKKDKLLPGHLFTDLIIGFSLKLWNDFKNLYDIVKLSLAKSVEVILLFLSFLLKL